MRCLWTLKLLNLGEGCVKTANQMCCCIDLMRYYCLKVHQLVFNSAPMKVQPTLDINSAYLKFIVTPVAYFNRGSNS